MKSLVVLLLIGQSAYGMLLNEGNSRTMESISSDENCEERYPKTPCTSYITMAVSSSTILYEDILLENGLDAYTEFILELEDNTPGIATEAISKHHDVDAAEIFDTGKAILAEDKEVSKEEMLKRLNKSEAQER